MAAPSSSVVALRVAVTLAAAALTRGAPGRSVLAKTMPVSAGAGMRVMVTSLPEWRPVPVNLAVLAIVVC